MLESDLKRTITDYLQYGQNQGKWEFLRLNSGEAFVKRGGKDYKIQLCEKGTPDFLVIKGSVGNPFLSDNPLWTNVIFLEVKSPKGKLTETQKEMKERLEKQGAKVFVVRSADEAISILNGGKLNEYYGSK